MRIIAVILGLLFFILQYDLWLGEGGLRTVWRLQQDISEQKKENKKTSERNESLVAEVKDLKQGNDAIEERARKELGMIKKGVFGSDYGLKIETDAIKVRKTDDRFIETVYSSDINRMFYKRHFFSGLESYFKYESYDNKITPTRALTFKASTGFKTELSEAKKTYGYLNTKLGSYLDIYRITFVLFLASRKIITPMLVKSPDL